MSTICTICSKPFPSRVRAKTCGPKCHRALKAINKSLWYQRNKSRKLERDRNQWAKRMADPAKRALRNLRQRENRKKYVQDPQYVIKRRISSERYENKHRELRRESRKEREKHRREYHRKYRQKHYDKLTAYYKKYNKEYRDPFNQIAQLLKGIEELETMNLQRSPNHEVPK